MPTSYDIWVSRELAGYLHKSPLFDLAVQTLIYQERLRIRIWTMIWGSMAAALLTIPISLTVHWLPPNQNPILSNLYPDYLDRNPIANSFPSQSTAVYSALAAGFYSLNRKMATACWIAVAILIALPRMFVGGHYLSDVLAGLVLGVAGYVIAKWVFARHIIPRCEQTCRSSRALQVFARVAAFLWILEVAVEFRDVVWLTRVSDYIWNR
jgi:membrane-associated phospholipid phosphatase